MIKKCEQSEFIETYLNPDIRSIKEIAQFFHLRYDTTKKKIKILRRKGLIPAWRDRDRFFFKREGEEDVSIASMRAAYKTLSEQLQREKMRTQLIAQACCDSIARLDIPRVKIPKEAVGKVEREEIHQLVSDVQGGSWVQLKDTGGLSEYSFDHFKQRLWRLRHKIELFKDRQSPKIATDKFVAHCLGDMVEGGGIFPAQYNYLDLIEVDQIFETVAEFSAFFISLAGIFHDIEIFNVIGNHGRVSHQAHTRVNWDYIFYKSLQTALLKQENIKVYISASPFCIVQHGNFIFYLTHGEKCRSWIGLPYYSLDRMARKLDSLTQLHINYVQIGHHHRAAQIDLPHGALMVNGSFVGGTEYSVHNLNEASVPKQVMYFFNPKAGVHSVSDLRLADPMPLRSSGQRALTPLI